MARRSGTDTILIRRHFGELPVVDAAESLRLVVRESDISKARPQNPETCVFARACKRQFGSRKVLFLRRVAYIELADKNGNRVVNRFLLRKEVADQIIKFDKTGEARPGGYLLAKPCSSRTLENMREYAARRDLEHWESHGTARPRPGLKKISKDRGISAELNDVRDGRGLVRFFG